jgi:hypothetical protein
VCVYIMKTVYRNTKSETMAGYLTPKRTSVAIDNKVLNIVTERYRNEGQRRYREMLDRRYRLYRRIPATGARDECERYKSALRSCVVTERRDCRRPMDENSVGETLSEPKVQKAVSESNQKTTTSTSTTFDFERNLHVTFTPRSLFVDNHKTCPENAKFDTKKAAIESETAGTSLGIDDKTKDTDDMFRKILERATESDDRLVPQTTEKYCLWSDLSKISERFVDAVHC